MCTPAAAMSEMPVAQEFPIWVEFAGANPSGCPGLDTDLTKWEEKKRYKTKPVLSPKPCCREGVLQTVCFGTSWALPAAGHTFLLVSAARGDRIRKEVVEQPAASTGSSNMRPWLRSGAPHTCRGRQTPPNTPLPWSVMGDRSRLDKEMDRETAA